MERASEGAATTAMDVGVDAPSLIAAAHELKAPLSLIRQLALTLSEAELVGLTNDDRERTLRRIILSAERSLRLTDALTRSSRIEEGMFELSPVNAVQIAEEVAHELLPLARERDRDIRVMAHNPPLALANSELTRQILFSLCENALQYSREGSPVTLRLTPDDGGERVRMGVRDDGPKGFDGALAKLAKTLGTKPQLMGARPHSSGLGLYVAERCARAMDGSIGLTRHRSGSTFYLSLRASHQLDIFRDLSRA
jgi:signal transduction histidine kinase